MSFFDKLKKRANTVPETFTSQIEYEGVAIEIEFNIKESKEHLLEDFAVLQKEGIENIIKSRFIPWFKADEFKDRNDDLIFEGLKIYGIEYYYAMIAARYSPTQKDEKVGQFDFLFESGNEYTADMMESTAMQIYVLNGQILMVNGYEV